MGTLTSTVNHAGRTVNGVLLGQPAILTADLAQPEPGLTVSELRFAWDDPGLPNGILNPDTGEVEVTDSEVPE